MGQYVNNHNKGKFYLSVEYSDNITLALHIHLYSLERLCSIQLGSWDSTESVIRRCHQLLALSSMLLIGGFSIYSHRSK